MNGVDSDVEPGNPIPPVSIGEADCPVEGAERMTNTERMTKERFLREMLLRNSVHAAFQHTNTYAKNVPTSKKESFRSYLKKRLEKLGDGYKSAAVSDEKHIANIRSLTVIPSGHAKSLAGGCFRFGVAQKALNLYLKYLWALGELDSAPPHCPFDRRVLSECGCGKMKPWTKMDSANDYKKWIEGARREAKAKSLPEWELSLFTP